MSYYRSHKIQCNNKYKDTNSNNNNKKIIITPALLFLLTRGQQSHAENICQKIIL